MLEKQIFELYNFLKLFIKNDKEIEIFFEKYSDIYVDEFFMFFSIKSYLSEIIAPIEINNILNDLIKNTYINDKIKRLSLKYSNNYFIYNINDYDMKLGQDNLKKYMKNIFNHDMISEFITNINLNINYYSNNISINTYNIILVNEVLDMIKKKININNNIYVEQNNKILNSIKTLNYYNINNDAELYCYNLQKG
jgi:hypothetical protein